MPQPEDRDVNLNVRVTESFRRRLKARCASEGITLAEGLERAFEAWEVESVKEEDQASR